MKIAVLIADSHGEPFETIRKKCLEEIWQKTPSEISVFTMIGKEVDFFTRILNAVSSRLKYSALWPIQRLFDKITLQRFKCRLPSVQLDDNVLKVEVSEGLRYLGPKYLASVQFLFNEGYDIVYKTTLSSVVQKDLLLNLLENVKPDIAFYAGSIVYSGNRQFASGANVALNQTMFNLVTMNLKKWDFADYDDVALGKIAAQENVVISEISTMNIGSVQELNLLTESQLSRTVHYRCKSKDSPRNDVEIIDKLLKRLGKINAG